MGIGDIGFLQQNPAQSFSGGVGFGLNTVKLLQDASRANDARNMFAEAAQTGQVNPLLAAASPELFQQANASQSAQATAQSEAEQAELQRQLDSAARDSKTALSITNPALRQEFLQRRVDEIDLRPDGDSSHTRDIMALPFEQQNIEFQDAINQVADLSSLGGAATENPAAVKETEWFLKQSPEVQEKHLEVKRKSNPTLAEKLEFEQSKSNIDIEEEGKKVSVKGSAARAQGFIDSGIEAADSLGNIARMTELLDSVETGGYDAAALRAKQIFGLESADEAELSAGLGKSILAQLKPIFGAAFTAQEGERLERIEAGFGKSTAGNRRLLGEVRKITERAARRGLKAAKSQGDSFTVSEIEGILEGLKGDKAPAKKPAGEAVAPTTIGRFQVRVN